MHKLQNPSEKKEAKMHAVKLLKVVSRKLEKKKKKKKKKKKRR